MPDALSTRGAATLGFVATFLIVVATLSLRNSAPSEGLAALAAARRNIHDASGSLRPVGAECTEDSYYSSHSKEFTNRNGGDGFGDDPESTLMDAALEALPATANNEHTTLIDIGGNVGGFSELLRKKWGPGAQLHIFEVLGSLVESLKTRFKDDRAATVHQKAASDGAEKVVKIRGRPHWDVKGTKVTAASILERPANGVMAYNHVIAEVPVVKLDDFVSAELRLPPGARISFLKVDTEGNDYKVLLGMRATLTARTVSVLFFETNPMQRQIGASLLKTVAYLEEVGYHAYYFGNKRLLQLNGLCPTSTVFSWRATGNVVALPANSDLERAVVRIFQRMRA